MMTSQMHQMMSKGNQVMETTPGQSQKLFMTPEAVNLTGENEFSCQRHNRQHNGKNYTSLGALLGLPVELPNGIAFK